MIIWDTIFDIFLFADIIIKLSSAFVKNSQLIDERVQIIINALKDGLVIDLICVLPWYAVYTQLMWFRILRLLQVNQLRTAMENAVLGI